MRVGKRARLIGLTLGVAVIPTLNVGELDAKMRTPVPSRPVTASAARPSQPWAQDSSDVPADKAARFGTLANGMRYVILHNTTPPGQSSLMLRIDAGSLMEKDDQLGLAHFMEHMAFNGTTHIPKNDLISILERLGLAFGADLNAATSFDETFYQLHLPKNDDKTIDTSLFVLREQVSEATMNAQDIVDERGVIAGEERLRNSPALRVAHAQIGFLGQGLKLPSRWPIGDLRIVNSATRDRFVDFYDSYYRPSRATLVAVGDFDVDAMETKIRKQFGDWQPKGPEGPEPDLGKVSAHAGEVNITVEPGAGASIALNWVRAPDLTPDTLAKRRTDLIEYLGFAVLSRRLGELSRTDDPPFVDARASANTALRSLKTVSISAQFVSGKWQRALAAIDQEQRRIAEFGVTDAELTREVADLRTRWQNAAQRASTRYTRNLASSLINSINEREVITSPETDLRLFEDEVKGLTAAEVNAALKPAFAGIPATTVLSPIAIEGGAAAVASAARSARAVAVTAPVAPTVKPWPYTNFGKAGTVVGKRELANLGATIVTFQNGVALTFKHTEFDKNTVSINVTTGSGEQAFSPDKLDPRYVLIGQMYPGGVGKMTYDEMARSLNGHLVGASFSAAGDRFLLSGGTRNEDLQLQMQVMAAYLTDPAFRSAPFDKTKAAYPMVYSMMLASPGGAFQAHAARLLAGGDVRASLLPPEAIESLSMEAYRPQLKELLGKGPIEVTMVGDLTLDDAIRVTANTFGALPARRPLDAPPVNAAVRTFPVPTAEPLKFTHEGLGEQGLGFVAWPATDVTHDLKEAERLQVLGEVLKLRALEEIRERQGLAYSPGVGASFSDAYKGYGVLSLQAQTAPDKLPAFFKAVDDIVQKLRDVPVSDDELKRAREPMVASALRNRDSNGWWMAKLDYLVDRPWYESQTFTDVANIQSMTPADIQALARKYLRPDLAWKAEVLPQGDASSATAPK